MVGKGPVSWAAWDLSDTLHTKHTELYQLDSRLQQVPVTGDDGGSAVTLPEGRPWDAVPATQRSHLFMTLVRGLDLRGTQMRAYD